MKFDLNLRWIYIGLNITKSPIIHLIRKGLDFHSYQIPVVLEY
jgi:hypothetical protein